MSRGTQTSSSILQWIYTWRSFPWPVSHFFTMFSLYFLLIGLSECVRHTSLSSTYTHSSFYSLSSEICISLTWIWSILVTHFVNTMCKNNIRGLPSLGPKDLVAFAFFFKPTCQKKSNYRKTAILWGRPKKPSANTPMYVRAHPDTQTDTQVKKSPCPALELSVLSTKQDNLPGMPSLGYSIISNINHCYF